MIVAARNILLVMALTFATPIIWGQVITASILGTVTDPQGGALPGAVVTVTNAATAQSQVLHTNASGLYQAPNLTPGNYEIKVEMQGFKEVLRGPITLLIDESQRVDISMTLGSVGQSIEVTGAVPQLQTETATVGAAVELVQTTELPLNGRSNFQLDLLIPGAQQEVGGSNLSGQGGSIEVHGQREASNYFWVDGNDNYDQAIGAYVIAVPPDSIQEFRVESPNYDAEFGRTAGAQINVITKSGGNTYHGDLYEFIRNSALDAKNYFDPAGKIPPYRRNQFGADFSGRIKRNRTFFYVAWEGLSKAQGESGAAVVPTPSEVQGIFPASIPLTNPATGLSFPNNTITDINPYGAALAALYPTSPTGVINEAPVGYDNDDVTVLKIDQVLTTHNQLEGRVAYEDVNANYPISPRGSVTNIPGYGLYIKANHNYTAGISDSQTFTPNLIGEFRVGWNRFTLHYLPEEGLAGNIAAEIGFVGIPTTGPNAHRDFGPPTLNMSGAYAEIGGGGALYGPFDETFYNTTFTWVKGKHSLKFGADYHIFRTNFDVSSNPDGTLFFNTAYSGNAFANLLLGLPDEVTSGTFTNINGVPDGDTNFKFHSPTYAGFVQDAWSVRHNLTLTLGLRYEYWPAITEAENRLSNFDYTTDKLLVAGQNGVGSALYHAYPYEYMPRVGFSWQPRNDTKTVVRGGYGIFYELTIINEPLGMRENAPFFTSLLTLGNGSTVVLNPDIFENGQPNTIPSINSFAVNYKQGRVQEYSLDIQRQLGYHIVADLGYVGTNGSHLYGTVNPNQPSPGPGSVQSRRPFPQWGNISANEPIFVANYNGLEGRLEKELSNGMQFLASYTWSHSLDDSSVSGGYESLQNSADPMGNYGSSAFDVRERFVFSYVYQLPFLREKKGLEGATLGGWQLEGILQLHDGNPVTPALSTDNSNTGQLADRPNLIGNPYVSTPTCKVHTATCWFNSAAFGAAPKYTFGDAARNSLKGPGFREYDFGVAKNFTFLKTSRVEFRAEVFNLFNNVNFDQPTATIGPSFGKITSADGTGQYIYGAREVQFGLRYIF